MKVLFAQRMKAIICSAAVLGTATAGLTLAAAPAYASTYRNLDCVHLGPPDQAAELCLNVNTANSNNFQGAFVNNTSSTITNDGFYYYTTGSSYQKQCGLFNSPAHSTNYCYDTLSPGKYVYLDDSYEVNGTFFNVSTASYPS
jgi:hypothetical protein